MFIGAVVVFSFSLHVLVPVASKMSVIRVVLLANEEKNVNFEHTLDTVFSYPLG